MTRHTLDARRLLCPMPVIRTQNRIKSLAPGDIVEVVCTDPGATNDIPAWCRMHGHTVIDTETRSGEFIITIEVGETAA
jgi:tRNA 2-thiouridine synthesizing protein A